MVTALPHNKFAFQVGRRSQDRNKDRYLIRRQGLKLPSHDQNGIFSLLQTMSTGNLNHSLYIPQIEGNKEGRD
jgi:hypothetical protein